MVKQTLKSDILWLFREYKTVQEFVAQTEAASLVIGSLGFFISLIGFSGTIPSAVGALGLASTVNEIVLRIYYNRSDPWKGIEANQRLVSTLANLIVGFILYLFVVEGAIRTPGVTTIQFISGIVIWFIAGIVYMRSYNMIKEEAHQATKIIVPSLVTIGYLMMLLVAVPMLIEAFISEQAAAVLQQTPSDLVNSTNSTPS